MVRLTNKRKRGRNETYLSNGMYNRRGETETEIAVTNVGSFPTESEMDRNCERRFILFNVVGFAFECM